MALFPNRLEAARDLARHLTYLQDQDPVILGLGNDGVVVGEVIARSLDAPLDVLMLERLTAPEAASQIVGVVDESGRISMIESTARWHHLSSQQMILPAREAFRQLQRVCGKVRAVLPSLELVNRTVIIVSEGVGTGARMLGAVASVRDKGARTICAAAPAGSTKATWQLHETADEVVIPHRPSSFKRVEEFYDTYHPVSDEMMLAILQRWTAEHPHTQSDAKTIRMKLVNENQQMICCDLDLPPGAQRGSGPYPTVIYAHGFESDGQSPRTTPVSQRLAKRGIIGARMNFTGHGRSEGSAEDATEERMMQDLLLVYHQLGQLHEVDMGRIGLCGSGTGGMLALRMAAQIPQIRALVIRGPVCGREVTAARAVRSPTLIIHAEGDTALADSVAAIDRMLGSTHELLRIPDSNRLFSDPISRELMIDASVNWLADHLLHAPTARSAQAAPSPG